MLLNSIALSYLGIGGRVWIIDIGRSFEKLCQTVGGQYLEFTPESDIRLNPFSMVEAKIGRASCRERVCLYV